MAIYRNISMNFWTDSKVVDNFSPEDKYFMLYCLTNPYTNLSGCYEISIKQMCRDTGYNEETTRKLIDRLQNTYEIIDYDLDNKELLIKNWYKYNWTKSEKLDKPLLKEIENIKTLRFKEYLGNLYNNRDTVSIPYRYTIDTTVSVSVSDTVSVNKKPTLEEIEKYILTKKLNVDGKKFYNYFETGNWTDSKGNKVKNWKQKLLTWNSFQPKEKQDNRYHAEEIDYEKYIANLQGGNL